MANIENIAITGVRNRSISRLPGGWDVGPEEYKFLGNTIGLPVGYNETDPNIQMLSSTIESIWADQLSGPSTDWFIHIYNNRLPSLFFYSLPSYITREGVRDMIETTLTNYCPEYRGNCIVDISLNEQKRNAKVTFADLDSARQARMLGNYFYPDNSHPCIVNIFVEQFYISFYSKIRTNLSTIVLFAPPGPIREQVLKMPEVLDSRISEYGFITLRLSDFDSCYSFVMGKKNQFDAAINIFPGPSPLPQSCSKTTCNLDNDVYTILKNSSPKLSDIFEQDSILTKVVDSSLLSSYQMNVLKIYNIIPDGFVKDDDILHIVAKDLREKLSEFGKIKTIDFKPGPQLHFHVAIIIFENYESAFLAQKAVARCYFAGRMAITQLATEKSVLL